LKKLGVFALFLFLIIESKAQIIVSFHWGNEPIALEKYYSFEKDSILFHEVKMYLSDFQFSSKNRNHQIIGPHLIQLEDSGSLRLFPEYPVEDCQSMRFHFGLDSMYQVSESVEGALNPMNGMYWAWNSGYIQFKCTGNSSAVKTSDQSFELHLGGYRRPFTTMTSIELPIKGNSLILDLKPFFEQSIELSNGQKIMVPGKVAQQYCHELSKYFRSE
jgi:hypothetical protein